MGEPSEAPDLRPVVPDGSSLGLVPLYVLELNPVGTHSMPLHLLIDGVEQRLQQCMVPLLAPNEQLATISIPPNNINFNAQEVLPPLKPETSNVNESNTEVCNFSKNQILTKDIKKDITKNKLVHTQKEDKKKLDCKIQQIQNYVHIPDSVVPPRAVAVLPKPLQIRRNCIYPRRMLPPRVRFGPVKGVINKIFPAEADELICDAAAARLPIFLIKKDEISVTHINVSNKDNSNWLSLLPLGKENTANVWLYEEDHQLFGITTENIPSRTPLALGYSQKYADEHNLPLGLPVLDLNEALAEPKWWCYECRRDMGSATLLHKHVKIYHTDARPPPRQKYRCKYCSRTFGRVFALRRHISQMCTKKPTKTNTDTEPKRPEPDSGISQRTENNRTPSDESFQNYTSALDFSINLFDPDKISNLDISGSSKSDTDFMGGWKFENLDNNEDYSRFCKGLKFGNDDNIKEKATESEFSAVTCVYCEQTMTRAKKRRHLKDCPARRLECECGKIFTKKEEFAKHVHANHITDSSKPQIKDEPVEDKQKLPYSCIFCKVEFKRRGMLVNHLVRVHKTSGVRVPFERRDLHYPCAVCPKIYSAAAKRDRHVRIHHPDTRIRAAPILGEKRIHQPAKCTACPREYATRSKLLQHIRALHPKLAISMKKPSPPPAPALKSKEETMNKLPTRPEPMLGFY